MKKILISCVVTVVAFAGIYFLFRETIDRFNPLIAEEYVYIEVQDEPEDDDGRYKYDLKGINEDKKTKRVIFSTSVILEQGTFIRVLAKGTHSIEYKFINEDEMP